MTATDHIVAVYTLEQFAESYEAMWERERRLLAQRLRLASDAVAELATRIDSRTRGPQGGWSARAVLAHIAVAAEGWEQVIARIAAGRIQQLRAADVVGQRDMLGRRTARLTASAVSVRALSAHRRLIRSLETMSRVELQREVSWELGRVSIEALFRVVVIAHLEAHVEQLRAAVQRQVL